MRIRFTRQLRDLRDNTVEEVEFPPDLTTTERKFLHKLAAELGLKSKSVGFDNDRRITVRKKISEVTSEKAMDDAIVFNISTSSAAALKSIEPLPAEFVSSISRNGQRTSKRFDKTSSASDDAARIISAHRNAQREMQGNTNYQQMKESRDKLPASQFAEAICRLIKENQVILVR